MKKLSILATLMLIALMAFPQQKYEYKVVTSVESIVPMGLGRSRIIETKEELNPANYTTERTNGKKSQQKGVKRSGLKVNRFAETKLLNFYSGVGINFQNIASNDALISATINKIINEGWQLAFVVSGVESDAGKGDGKGIFITRYIFRRPIQ
ncbi:hypothetical protein LA303_09310 [Candidatus Sulfidibacterium hydrothermale]|uniref:hypothetical protein n=1 Tax=Candidatus Sulfidibacterium hydrothermale TaxID=2875962 RepID=UPI001F0B3133|nr:hypothetical protein [Candidatus Sulfidibacterium hydrothermale]UBM61610.1 hypothetical protein LA303_09310 [Candidatus Sulfidibacterium hydrothermale]